MQYKKEIESRKDFWERVLGQENCQRLVQQREERHEVFREKGEKELERLYQKLVTEESIYGRDAIRTSTFGNFYSFFGELAKQYWKTKHCTLGKDSETLLEENLYPRIEAIPLRVLIKDIHHKKGEGLLRGSSPEEEYEDYYQRFLGSNSYIGVLCESYPEMKRLLFLQILETVNLLEEIAEAVNRDKKNLVTYFFNGKEFDFVEKVTTGLSDVHQGGRSVAKILFDNGEVLFYKPHCLKKEVLFQKVYQSCCLLAGVPTKELRVLDCTVYGWEECVYSRSCDTEEGLKRYYERMGILLFLCYMMNASDMHGENVIADGEYPFLIDLETFPGCYEEGAIQNANDMIREELKQSVLYTGLLPVIQWGQQGEGVVLNALHRKGKVKAPIRVPVLLNPKSSSVAIGYTEGELNLSNSIPKYDEKESNPAEHKKEICKGFKEAYLWMLREQESIREQLSLFFEEGSRYLIRHTQQYSMYLRTSLYADFLESSEKRYLFLHVLDKGRVGRSKQEQFLEYERRELEQMHIPIFYVSGVRHAVFDGDGKEYPEFLTVSMQELWEKKLQKLGMEDLEKQLRYIELSLALLEERNQKTFERRICSGVATSLEKRKENFIKTTADTICRTAFIFGEDINWSGLRFYDEKSWNIVPLGMYLYDGISGLACFMACVRKKYPNPHYEQIYRLLKKKLFDYTDGVISGKSSLESEHTGALIGEGSIIHAYVLLYEITKEADYLSYAKKHEEILPELLEKATVMDYLSGYAGLIVVLLKLYRLTGDDKESCFAVELEKEMWKRVQKQEVGCGWSLFEDKPPLAGMAHGNSGFILAYAYLYEAIRDDSYLEKMRMLIEYENHLYSKELGNWKDLRKEGKEKRTLTAWCHGAAGILLSRLKLRQCEVFEDEEIVEKDIERCVAALLTAEDVEDVCLCHGMAGRMLILQRYLKNAEHEQLQKKQQEMEERLLERLENQKDLRTQEWHNVSLMMGMSGVGMAFLNEGGFLD